MTDSDTTLQQPASNNPAPNNPASGSPAPAPAAAKSHTASFVLLWLFVVLIVAAVCYGALFVSQQSKSQQQIINSLRAQVEQQAQAIETRQQTLEDNLDKELVAQ